MMSQDLNSLAREIDAAEMLADAGLSGDARGIKRALAFKDGFDLLPRYAYDGVQADQMPIRNAPALNCGNCGRAIAPGEIVMIETPEDRNAYRKRDGQSIGLGTLTLCRDCGDIDPDILKTDCWRHCDHCGRAMLFNGKSNRRRYCSDACHRAASRAQRSEATCTTCGSTFMPARVDARFCSSACRQKAYRARRGAA